MVEGSQELVHRRKHPVITKCLVEKHYDSCTWAAEAKLRRRRTREREVTSDWLTVKEARRQVIAIVAKATMSQVVLLRVLSRRGV